MQGGSLAPPILAHLRRSLAPPRVHLRLAGFTSLPCLRWVGWVVGEFLNGWDGNLVWDQTQPHNQRAKNDKNVQVMEQTSSRSQQKRSHKRKPAQLPNFLPRSGGLWSSFGVVFQLYSNDTTPYRSSLQL